MAATMSILAIIASILDRSMGWPMDRVIFVIIATAAAGAAAAIFCTSLSLDALGRAKEELIDNVCVETKALHRAMVVTMEQYGDSRAIDAFVASEHRRSVNERSGEATVELNGSAHNMANVTPLRKRS